MVDPLSPASGGLGRAEVLRADVGVLESQIDIYFGWQERVLRKAMQVHYEQLSLASRMALAKITGML